MIYYNNYGEETVQVVPFVSQLSLRLLTCDNFTEIRFLTNGLFERIFSPMVEGFVRKKTTSIVVEIKYNYTTTQPTLWKKENSSLRVSYDAEKRRKESFIYSPDIRRQLHPLADIRRNQTTTGPTLLFTSRESMDYGIFGREVSRFSSFNSLHSSADRIEIFDGLRGSVNGERIA